jgi:DnaJ family protein A protein 2
MVKDTILYDRLEVTPDSTEPEIKKAYNRLSKIYHPDKCDNKEIATKKFQEINEAKEILLTPDKRSQYDKIGIDILNPELENQQSMFNPFANFESMFGQNFQFGATHPSKKQQCEDISKILDVTLEQIYNEETINLTYEQKNYCVPCNGEGSNNGLSNNCTVCNGKGVHIQIIRMGPMIQQSVGQCHNCAGTGKIIDPNNFCTTCNGKCYNKKIKTVQIPLKAGLTHNNKISLNGKGHQYKTSKTDLILTINELPHAYFKRYENDLFIEINLKLYQSLFGFNKIINHLDGRQIYICSSDKTNFNCVRKIKNEGMKCLQSNIKGDLYIKFIVEIPNTTSIDNNIKNQLKLLLQTIDNSEVTNENLIKQQGLSNVILNECNNETANLIINLFNNTDINNKNTGNNDTEDSNHDHDNNGNSGNQHECRQS